MAGFGGWATAVLHAIGAPVTPQNLQALLAWQRAEGGSARFNPLNTTQGAKGASNYNSVGVKNFTSSGQGVQATAHTLLNGHYGNIVNDLRSGKATAAQIGTDVAHSPWGTGGGVLRVLGSGPVPVPKYGKSTPAPQRSTGVDPNAIKNLVAGYLLQNSQNMLQGNQPGSSGLLGLAIARSQLKAAQTANGPVARSAAPAAPHGGQHGVSFEGDLTGVKTSLVSSISQAAAAVGGKKIRVISGYRSPAHNAASGGVAHSNHLTGDAMDAEVFIPGRGWVPLGAAIKPVAAKYGLRSGDVPGFYHGGPDPNHVDDGANQR